MAVSSLGLSCPTGGSFYICANNATEFIGCCTTNPCADGSGSCPKSNLRAASFSGDSYGEIPAQQCAGGSGSSALWYTCQKSLPPFLGCCSTNPCAQGSCPSADLAAASLSSNATSRAVFMTMGAVDPSSTPTPTPSSDPPAAARAVLSTGSIAGIAVGGALLLLVIAGFTIYKCGWCRRIKEKKDSFESPFIPAGLVSYPGGVQPAGSPSLPTALSCECVCFGKMSETDRYPAPQTPTFPYAVSSPGSPPASQQLFPGYKPHDSVISSVYSSVGSPLPRGSQFSGYPGSEGTYQPASELDASTVTAVTPELQGSEVGRDWSTPTSPPGRGGERQPATPQHGWMGRGNGEMREYRASR
ncbi:hypothetical protein QBC34DRAFT_149406 [Podospora aff. communis PSN243]|uniref:Uncharacterized protein n=1 Tax=Podospora aff. communis PSN243 TaxID=3040156 RepID=A0AAV9GEP7_9PEZI|nr:hypothetical protein QBC34DRAFT_149406 [Podospora aff. communis PSN243]